MRQLSPLILGRGFMMPVKPGLSAPSSSQRVLLVMGPPLQVLDLNSPIQGWEFRPLTWRAREEVVRARRVSKEVGACIFYDFS